MPWKAWVAAVAIAGAAFAADRADAAPNVAHLSWGSQLNPSDCPDDGYRYLEVNVTGQVVQGRAIERAEAASDAAHIN